MLHIYIYDISSLRVNGGHPVVTVEHVTTKRLFSVERSDVSFLLFCFECMAFSRRKSAKQLLKMFKTTNS